MWWVMVADCVVGLPCVGGVNEGLLHVLVWKVGYWIEDSNLKSSTNYEHCLSPSRIMKGH